MSKYTLALQTPSVILNVPVKDAAGKTDQLQVEFKRYPIKEANQHLAKFDKIAEANQQTLEATKDGSSSIWESSVVNEAEDIKAFVREHIVDFLNVRAVNDSGKQIKVPSVKAEGDLDTYFNMLWDSFPYRDALRTATLQAIQNTASNQ
jgi:hypothetical protein